MTPTATSHNSTLNVSCIEYTTNTPLQSIILDVVDAIISQDSSGRGAWTRVVTKRIALDSTYIEQVIKREIDRMLMAGSLYESCYEIRNGTLHMTYIRNSSELLGSATSKTDEEQDK